MTTSTTGIAGDNAHQTIAKMESVDLAPRVSLFGKSESKPLAQVDSPVATTMDIFTPPTATRAAPSLVTLPPELHLLIYSDLDAIDSVCLSLAHPKFYVLHRSLNEGKPTPLNVRRQGINPFESAWAPIFKSKFQGCSHCGTNFCQLYRHVASWMSSTMGEDAEYCLVRERFGKKGEGRSCYRSCPPKPGVCGRHGVKPVAEAPVL